MKTIYTSIMKFVFVSLLVTPLFISVALPQEAQASGWVTTIGGEDYDHGRSVQQTTDGGYIIAGTTSSYGSGNSDIYLIKTNANGDIEWQKTFGGNNNDNGFSVQQTIDGGYIIVGDTYSYGADGSDVYLIKTNEFGNAEWQRTFGGGGNEEGHSVQQTTEGDYIIAGDTSSYGSGNSDVYLIKTNANGDLEWQKTFGGKDNDYGYSVKQTTDGGYIITGGTYSYGFGERDVYLVKTDAFGSAEWEKTFGGEDIDEGFSVQQTTDGGYIIVGDTESYGAGDYDVYLAKTDASGNKVWQKTFGGEGADVGYSAHQTTDGGYIIAGTIGIYGFYGYFLYYDLNVYLVKTDASGNKVWQKTFGGEVVDVGYSAQQTSDGGYIIAGDTYSYGAGDYDVYFIKTDEYGNTE